MKWERPESTRRRAPALDREKRIFYRSASILSESAFPFLVLIYAWHGFGHVRWSGFASRDIEIYSTIARFWSDGFLPYRDLYDFKPPLIYLTMRIAMGLGGYELAPLWRLFVVLATAGTLGMYAGLRRGGQAFAAPVAGLAFLTLINLDPLHQVGWHFQNTETLVVVFGALAFGCASAHMANPQWWWCVGTGACLALAALGKQPGLLFALPLGLQLCLWGSRGSILARARFVVERALLAAVGVTAVCGSFAIYFAWHGGLGDLFQAVVLDGLDYSAMANIGHVSFLRQLGAIATRPSSELVWQSARLPQMWPYVGAVVALAALTLLRPSRSVLVAWSWLVSGYLAVVVGPRREGHYVAMLIPALAITVGLVWQMVIEAVASTGNGSSARVPRRLVGGLVVALFLFGPSWWVDWAPKVNVDLKLAVREVQQQEIGREIRRVAQPGDTLFVRDEPVSVYMFSGMPPPLKYLTADFPRRSDVQRQWAEIADRRPTFIYANHATKARIDAERETGADKSPLEVVGAKSVDEIHDWTQTTRYLDQIIVREYDQWLTKPIGVVYRRRDRAAR